MSPPLPSIDIAFCRRPNVERYILRLQRDLVARTASLESTLWLLNGDGTALTPAVNCGEQRRIVESVPAVPVGRSVIGWVATSGESRAIGPADSAQQHPTTAETSGIPVEAMAAAPVRWHGEVQGVLSVINPTSAETYSRDDLDDVTWHAYLLGLILEDLRRGEP